MSKYRTIEVVNGKDAAGNKITVPAQARIVCNKADIEELAGEIGWGQYVEGSKGFGTGVVKIIMKSLDLAARAKAKLGESKVAERMMKQGYILSHAKDDPNTSAMLIELLNSRDSDRLNAFLDEYDMPEDE